MSPGDIAIYSTLCALASLSRQAIKKQIIENQAFGAYIEHEPYVRELMEAYLASNFKTVFEIVSRYSVRLSSPLLAFLYFVMLISYDGTDAALRGHAPGITHP